MKEEKNNFRIIFKELELKNSKELLQLTKDIKIVVKQVEHQKEELEKISALSSDTNQIYFSTGT